MTLIKSISGIRGTTGGPPGEGLTPYDIVAFTSSFADLVRKKYPGGKKITVVTGRDGRLSGPIVSGLVNHTLMSMGIHVIDLGLSTTPTVEMAVKEFDAQGGIILTASHNPMEWNALKMLNDRGEFISAEEGENILKIAAGHSISYAGVNELGQLRQETGMLDLHIKKILQLPYVDSGAIGKADFKVVI